LCINNFSLRNLLRHQLSCSLVNIKYKNSILYISCMTHRKKWNDIPFLRTTDSLQTVKEKTLSKKHLYLSYIRFLIVINNVAWTPHKYCLILILRMVALKSLSCLTKEFIFTNRCVSVTFLLRAFTQKWCVWYLYVSLYSPFRKVSNSAQCGRFALILWRLM